MFKLPVCPYCHTVYRYKDVRSVMTKKELECYNCKKKIKISKKGIWILALIAVILSVASTFLILNIFHNATAIFPYIVTVLIIIAAFFARPFFVTFKSNEKSKEEKKR